MLDEREAPVARGAAPGLQPQAGAVAHRRGRRRPRGQLLLAIVAYWALFLAGESGYAPVIGEVEAGSIAEVAGLESGQEIVAVDGARRRPGRPCPSVCWSASATAGPIRFAVRYPDSDVVYESRG
jgi:regulator of sigma E protease